MWLLALSRGTKILRRKRGEMVTKDHDSVVHVHDLELEENIELGSV
jgi:hypothetical protein